MLPSSETHPCTLNSRPAPPPLIASSQRVAESGILEAESTGFITRVLGYGDGIRERSSQFRWVKMEESIVCL